MDANIFIPKKCKVGFNLRSDTYTGKLGYVIYNDGKVWRKETSWENWRQKYISQEEFDKAKLNAFNREVERWTAYYNESLVSPPSQSHYDHYSYCRDMTLEEFLAYKRCSDLESYSFSMGNSVPDITIKPIEFDNEPLEGFVLNRKAGGVEESYGWNARQSYCRVYDPRGFEFEITIQNLLYILENSNSIKGKGLEGKFMYGWDGKDLVLLPENSPEFQKNIRFTDMQSIKLKKADLIVGGTYLCKDNVERTFMGESNYYNYYGIGEGKKLWFWEANSYYKDRFETYPIDKPKVFIGRDEEFAAKMDLLKIDSHYTQPELEYEAVNLSYLEQLQAKTNNNPYSSRASEFFWVLEGKKYKRAEIEIYRRGYEYDHRVSIGRQQYEYTSLVEILNNHKLWQITKTTKES